MGHGEVFGRVARVERPQVDDLAAVGVDDLDRVAGLEAEGGAGAGGEGLGGGHGLGNWDGDDGGWGGDARRVYMREYGDIYLFDSIIMATFRFERLRFGLRRRRSLIFLPWTSL